MIPRPTTGIKASVPTPEEELREAIRRSPAIQQRLVEGGILTELDREHIFLLWSKGVWHPGNLPRVPEPSRLFEQIEEAVLGGERIRAAREHDSKFALERIKAIAVALEADRDALATELSKAQADLKHWQDRAVEAETRLALGKEAPCIRTTTPKPPSGSSTGQ